MKIKYWFKRLVTTAIALIAAGVLIHQTLSAVFGLWVRDKLNSMTWQAVESYDATAGAVK